MIGRLWAWWRARKSLVDFVFMSPILILTVMLTNRDMALLVISACLALPLVLRRRWPRAVFAVIALAAFGQWLAEVPLQLADVAVLVGLYTVAADCAFRWGVAAALTVEFGAGLEVLQQEKHWRLTLLLYTIGIAGIWVLGIYISTRRAYLRSVEEKAARLERERDIQVQIAMAAERARIARELHDVVAHNVSVIVVQADGAAYAIDTDTERAKRAMEAISSTGRQALTEMRRLLGVLREGDDAGPYAPQPGLDQLTDLIDQVRASGLPLELTITGVPRVLSAGMQLTLFRIVQEALTNTLKHAGSAAAAQVQLHYGDDAIEVTVDDDGLGAATDDGLGHGLVGMRERAAIYGGSVQAGPRADGGFRVVVRLPLQEGART